MRFLNTGKYQNATDEGSPEGAASLSPSVLQFGADIEGLSRNMHSPLLIDQSLGLYADTSSEWRYCDGSSVSSLGGFTSNGELSGAESGTDSDVEDKGYQGNKANYHNNRKEYNSPKLYRKLGNKSRADKYVWHPSTRRRTNALLGLERTLPDAVDEQGAAPATSDPRAQKKETKSALVRRSYVQKCASRPQLKAFKRISNELQNETFFFENEIQHEAALTYKLKDDDLLLNQYKYVWHCRQNNQNEGHAEDFDAGEKGKNSEFAQTVVPSFPTDKHYLAVYSEEAIRKSQLIAKINKSWNARSRRSSNPSTFSTSVTEKDEPLISLRHNLKRQSKDWDSDDSSSSAGDYASSSSNSAGHISKRRVVSNSPILSAVNLSPSIVSKGGSKLVSSASEDLEKMCLDATKFCFP